MDGFQQAVQKAVLNVKFLKFNISINWKDICSESGQVINRHAFKEDLIKSMLGETARTAISDQHYLVCSESAGGGVVAYYAWLTIESKRNKNFVKWNLLVRWSSQ